MTICLTVLANELCTPDSSTLIISLEGRRPPPFFFFYFDPRMCFWICWLCIRTSIATRLQVLAFIIFHRDKRNNRGMGGDRGAVVVGRWEEMSEGRWRSGTRCTQSRRQCMSMWSLIFIRLLITVIDLSGLPCSCIYSLIFGLSQFTLQTSKYSSKLKLLVRNWCILTAFLRCLVKNRVHTIHLETAAEVHTLTFRLHHLLHHTHLLTVLPQQISH